MPDPTFTLSLGGGGIGGIGHIPVLQGLDDLKIQPKAISGVSAGAIVGACYAAGMSGDAIHAHVLGLSQQQTTVLVKALWRGSFLTGREAIHVIDTILPDAVPDRFEDLQIPLTIGTTDIEARESIYFSSGALRPLIAASMTIPGLFLPVAHQGRNLVDGGVLDNFALGTLPKSDLTIAVDAASQPQGIEVPRKGLRAGLHAMRVMMEAMAEDNFAKHKPDVVIRARKVPITAEHLVDAEALLTAVSGLRAETVKKVSAAISAWVAR